MNQLRKDLFRKEALDAHGRGGLEGRLLRLSPAWVPWAYRVTVAAFAVSLAFAYFGRVPSYAHVPSVVRTGTLEAGPPALLTALVPARLAARLSPGSPVLVGLAGHEHEAQRGAVASVGPRALEPPELRTSLGRELADALDAHEAGVLVDVTLPEALAGTDGQRLSLREGERATVDVEVGSERILHVLFPGLEVVR